MLSVIGNPNGIAGKDFGDFCMEDVKIREYLKNKLKDAAVSHIEIERAANRVNVTIHTAKPVWLSVKAAPKLKTFATTSASMSKVKKFTSTFLKSNIRIWMLFLLLKALLNNLERRVSFRRAMKQAIQRTMRSAQKVSKQPLADVWAVLKLLVRKDTAKEQFRFIHFVRISIMAQLKRILLTAVSA